MRTLYSKIILLLLCLNVSPVYSQDTTETPTEEIPRRADVITMRLSHSPTDSRLAGRDSNAIIYHIELNDRPLTKSDKISVITLKSLESLMEADRSYWQHQEGFVSTKVGQGQQHLSRIVGLDSKSKLCLIRIGNDEDGTIYYVNDQRTFGASLDRESFADIYDITLNHKDLNSSDKEAALLRIVAAFKNLEHRIVAEGRSKSTAQMIADHMSGVLSGKYAPLAKEESTNLSGTPTAVLMHVSAKRLKITNSSSIRVYENTYSKTKSEFEKDLIDYFRDRFRITSDNIEIGIGSDPSGKFFGVVVPVAQRNR